MTSSLQSPASGLMDLKSKSDDFGFPITRDKVHVHDLHATILHLLGLDHERLTYRHPGRDFRLTDVAVGWRRRSWRALSHLIPSPFLKTLRLKL